MSYCPKCKSEYRIGFTVCHDCNLPLVEVLQEVNQDNRGGNAKEEYYVCMNPVKLVHTSNNMETGMLTELLEQNGIQTLINSPGAGSYMNLTMGSSYYGEIIYVDKADYEKAKEVLEVRKLD